MLVDTRPEDRTVLTYVVTEDCHRCRFTDCVEACPVDCFHGDAEMLYIDPVRCIDCGVCVPTCPVEAIFDEGSLPDRLQGWLAVNAERSARLPVVRERQPPLPGAHALALSRARKS
jgi:ferredoxin